MTEWSLFVSKANLSVSVFQVCAPATNAEEAEVEQFYEDLQNLLSEVAQLCPTPSDPPDCSLPGSSIHGIFQARVLEWGAIVIMREKLKLNGSMKTYKTF